MTCVKASKYSYCNERATVLANLGESKEGIAFDQEICERSQKTSMMVSLAVSFGGSVSKTVEAGVGRFAATVKNTDAIKRVRGLLEDYLGKNAKVITNKAGDKIFRNAENTRRVRFDIRNTHGDNPHMHVEIKQGTRWQDYTGQHRIYFNGR